MLKVTVLDISYLRGGREFAPAASSFAMKMQCRDGDFVIYYQI
jgi:hypothetical protein